MVVRRADMHTHTTRRAGCEARQAGTGRGVHKGRVRGTGQHDLGTHNGRVRGTGQHNLGTHNVRHRGKLDARRTKRHRVRCAGEYDTKHKWC